MNQCLQCDGLGTWMTSQLTLLTGRTYQIRNLRLGAPTSTQVDDLGDSQATLVGEDDPESVDASLPLVSRTVDHVGVVIEFNSNRSDEDGGRSEESPQPRGPSRTNGSPGRGLPLPEPHPNTGV